MDQYIKFFFSFKCYRKITLINCSFFLFPNDQCIRLDSLTLRLILRNFWPEKSVNSTVLRTFYNNFYICNDNVDFEHVYSLVIKKKLKVIDSLKKKRAGQNSIKLLINFFINYYLFKNIFIVFMLNTIMCLVN